MPDFKTYIFSNQNYVDIVLYQFGSERCEPLHSFGPCIKNHYLFHYVVSGKGRLYPVDGKTGKSETHVINKGEGFLIVPHTINTYVADETDPWTYMWVEFDGLKASSYLQDAGLSNKNPIYYPKIYLSDNDILFHLTSIVEHPDAPDQAHLGHLYLFFNALLENSIFSNRKESGNLQEFYVREAINYIEKNYYRDISVEDIAQWCNLNRSYFGKIFKNSMKTTPQDFLIRYRLSKACDMLKSDNFSIKEISEITGYPNQFYFSRSFKHVYNMSPREWRNLNRVK